jgi:hypothetical protein
VKTGLLTRAAQISERATTVRRDFSGIGCPSKPEIFPTGEWPGDFEVFTKGRNAGVPECPVTGGDNGIAQNRLATV